MVNPIPDGYHSITPYLIVPDGAAALTLYAKALGAVETLRLDGPDGSVMHAEMKIGDSVFMLGSPMDDKPVAHADADAWPPISLMLYVEDCDALYEQAVAAGFASEQQPADQFYGDRTGRVRDPYGHRWAIATHIEDLTPTEIDRRAAELFGGATE